MKNIFIAGLQRSGTNYAQSLINKNVDVNVFWGAFHVENKEDENALWKHNIEPLSQELIDKYNIHGSILIIKNPYSWVESIVYRNHIDIIESYNDKYQILENLEGKIYRIPIQFNVRNLIRLYKNFYINWMNHGAYPIKYEDLLSDKCYELNKFAVVFGLNINEHIEDVEFVKESEDFNKNRIINYINVEISNLSNEDISIINTELGELFFDIMRYEIKNPN